MSIQSQICKTCGTQYPENTEIKICKICAEERQYIPLSGQAWITPKSLAENHEIEINKVRGNLYEIYITPKFAIGQRAFLVITEKGNFLWDCIPLLNQKLINFILSKGGLKAIGISHPHYYSNMKTWSKTFDCPVFIHQKDEDYIVDKFEKIQLWKKKKLLLWEDLKLINLGGHFEGGSVLLIQNMTSKGCMLCSDILQISLSRKFIAMMYSYPNNIPLPLSEIKRIKNRLEELGFDTLYGAFLHQNLTENVKEILAKSIARYFA